MKHNPLALALGWSLFFVAGLCCSSTLAWAPEGAAARADDDSAADAEATARAKKIESLIAQLGADDFFARERAQQELAEVGYEAFDALSEAADNDEDIEIKLRAGYLVRLMRLASVVDSDPPEIKELLRSYENLSEAERISLIKQVAAQSPETGLPVLCRLVRFERSAMLSKEAAVAVLMQKWPSDKAAAARRAETIRRGIGQSGRPAAAWLTTYLAGHKDPAAAIDDWQKLVAAEERRAVEAPHQTGPEIIAALWRETAILLRQVGREDEADRLLTRLVDREASSTSIDSLEELLRWLVDQRAFNVVDRLAEKFADRFQEEPLLLYALAEARQAEGKEQLVSDTIAKALALGDGPEAFKDHWRVAMELMRRHHWRWAEDEFRRVAGLAPDDDRFSIDARVRLSEVLHDRGADQEAGEILDKVLDAMDKNVAANNEDGNAGRTPEAARARMHYFHACSLLKPEQKKERLRRLLDALDADPTDADVLIAVYRTEALDPPLVEQNLQRIRSAAELFRQQMQQTPDDPTPYNQFAWLIANTEGDYKEALRASEKSLELVRANPRMAGSEASFLDTLGRCYYAVGDVENAVKAQARAVELDPDSGLMSKQLEFFRRTLDEKKKQ
jgi:tetratricopeptide (TPR) repeat protein